MENKLKFVSMYEITKMKFKGLNEFERELMFKEWLNDFKLIDDMNEKIGNATGKESIDYSNFDVEKSMKETIERMRTFLENKPENFMELPLKVYRSNGKIWTIPMEYEDEIMYELHLSTDVNTGKLSVQYRGENGSFLTHKQIVKALKKENNF